MNSTIRIDLAKRISAIDSLPTIPAAIRPLLDLLGKSSDQVDLEKVIESVSLDKTVTAQILRVCNSALHSRAQRIESVRGGVLSLGLRRVQEIVFACTFCQALRFKEVSLDPMIFWRHSLGCALVSRKLSSLIDFANPELAYLAGLLHDIGFQVNSLIDAERWQTVVQRSLTSQKPILEVESSVLGYTHCQTGRVLADQWQLPEVVADVIEYHHMLEGEPAGELVAIVHIADLLCRMRDMGYGYYEPVRVDLMSDPAWALLAAKYRKLSSMDLALFTFELDALMGEVQRMVDEIFSMGAVTH